MARFIHHYETNSEFTSVYNGTGYTEPWVSYTVENEQLNYNKKPGIARVVFDTGWTNSIETNFLTNQQAYDLTNGNWEYDPEGTYDLEKCFKLIYEGGVTGHNASFSLSYCYSVTIPEGVERVGLAYSPDTHRYEDFFPIHYVSGKRSGNKSQFEINLPFSLTEIGTDFVSIDDKYGLNTEIIINYPGTIAQFNTILGPEPCWYYIGWAGTITIVCSNGNLVNPEQYCGE